MSSFWSNSYIEPKSISRRNRKLSVKEYLNKISPYLKDMINNLKRSDTSKIQSVRAHKHFFFHR